MKAKRVMRVLLVVALIVGLATPAFANWQSLGWAFFGLAAFNSLAAASAYARPYPAYPAYPAPAYCAPAPVYYYPPPPVYYPYGYYPRPYYRHYWR